MPVTYLIDSTFFVNEIEIPNKTQTDVIAEVTAFIQKYESKCLLKILGYSLFKSYTANPATQRMLDLINGCEYTVGDELCFWQGLVHGTKQSLIAQYIYWFWEQSNGSKTSGIGTVIPKGASLVSVSPAWKMTAAWSFFSTETNSMVSFLRRKKIGIDLVYPEFTYRQAIITSNLSRPLGL